MPIGHYIQNIKQYNNNLSSHNIVQYRKHKQYFLKDVVHISSDFFFFFFYAYFWYPTWNWSAQHNIKRKQKRTGNFSSLSNKFHMLWGILNERGRCSLNQPGEFKYTQEVLVTWYCILLMLLLCDYWTCTSSQMAFPYHLKLQGA